MAKARKLKSGSWRCRVMLDGRSKSFTVKDPTRKGKAECERLASEWLSNASKKSYNSKTVKEALDDYIKLKEKSLSVTTITAYKSMKESAYGSLLEKPVSELSNSVIQEWIDEYKQGRKPKTVRNAYGLLEAAIGEETGMRFKVRLPESKEPEYYTPTDEDVKKILNEVKGTEIEKAVLLAALGTLRRGEVCALLASDIQGNTVTVSKSYVWGGDKYTLKAPKTVSSIRTVNLPPKAVKTILRGLNASDRVINMTPHILSKRFKAAVKRAGVPYFRFHDLRAYSASIRHALGIPDQYIMADGGWKTDTVLKKVYRRSMEDKRKEFSDMANQHFDSLL